MQKEQETQILGPQKILFTFGKYMINAIGKVFNNN